MAHQVCAEAETGDNQYEQEGETGTRICYGDVIQVRILHAVAIYGIYVLVCCLW